MRHKNGNKKGGQKREKLEYNRICMLFSAVLYPFFPSSPPLQASLRLLCFSNACQIVIYPVSIAQKLYTHTHTHSKEKDP